MKKKPMKRRKGYRVVGKTEHAYFANCPLFTLDMARRVRHWRFMMHCSWSKVDELFCEYYGASTGYGILYHSGRKPMKLRHTLGHRLTTLGIEMLKDKEWLDYEQS